MSSSAHFFLLSQLCLKIWQLEIYQFENLSVWKFVSFKICQFWKVVILKIGHFEIGQLKIGQFDN